MGVPFFLSGHFDCHCPTRKQCPEKMIHGKGTGLGQKTNTRRAAVPFVPFKAIRCDIHHTNI